MLKFIKYITHQSVNLNMEQNNNNSTLISTASLQQQDKKIIQLVKHNHSTSMMTMESEKFSGTQKLTLLSGLSLGQGGTGGGGE
jgi:hypothetical protein